MVKPSAFWWSIMSIPGTPICSTFPSPTNWGRRWSRKNQSSLNTYCQRCWSADLPNYFISLVLFSAAMRTLGNTASWNFSHFRGLQGTKISSLFFCYCHIFVPWSDREKKNWMWQSLTLVKLCVYGRKYESCLPQEPRQCKWIHVCTIRVQMYLEILFDTLWIEAFWDDHHPSLDAETQSNLCSCLVVLSANGIQHRVLQ